MKQQGKVWDRFAKRYARSPVADEDAYQKKLQVTREYLRPDMEVLEFGCGTGSTAVIHAPYVKHIQAIDISPKMLALAQGKVDAKIINNITFAQSGIEAFSVADRSFDVVMGHSILHLVADKEKVIAKVHDLLKPGGIFVSSTVCMGGAHIILRFVMPIGGFLGLLPLLKFFSVKELADSIIDAGFEIEHQWQPGKDKAVFIVAKKAG
ncbi:MAG: class I SAM-dependent methyltransferase [Paracoccaceae bacterium]